MKLDKKTARLICYLEYCIGKECYNPNAYDGWTGEEGLEFRYPVYFQEKRGDKALTKSRDNVAVEYPGVGVSSVETMKYKFGSNHLFVGLGIKNLLEELEKRYGLDFNELESRKRWRTKK